MLITKRNYYTVLSARIEAGIKALDKQFPRVKWLKKIDVDVLDLGDTSTCVCGQVFGDYMKAVFGKLKFEYDFWGDDDDEQGSEKVQQFQYDHGFELENQNADWYDALTHMWFVRLSELQAKAQPAKKKTK